MYSLGQILYRVRNLKMKVAVARHNIKLENYQDPKLMLTLLEEIEHELEEMED